jgi:hypothetical protein
MCGKSFTHEKRASIDLKTITPGPGAYKFPTLF